MVRPGKHLNERPVDQDIWIELVIIITSIMLTHRKRVTRNRG
jgi:hypothetical protein